MVVLLLAWTSPAVALGGLAVHLEMEHGHLEHGRLEHAQGEHRHAEYASAGHEDSKSPQHPSQPGHHSHSHLGHSHPAAVGSLSCEPGESHGGHFSDGSHHHHTLGLPGHDHQLLPARDQARLAGPTVQAVPQGCAVAASLTPSAGRSSRAALPPRPAPHSLNTVLLL